MATPVVYYKNGKKYYKIQVYLGTDPLTGKRVKTTISGCKTQKEAQQKARQLKVAFENGLYKKQTFATYQDVFNQWIETYEKTVEESTFLKTSRIFKNHILPSMGNYRIEKINVQICQKHINEWANKLQNFRVVKAYASKVLDYAMKLDLIKSNPFKLVEMPKRKKELNTKEEVETQFYTKEELKKFLDCLEKENNYMVFAFFRLLAYSGMRKGEALALTWEDIDFNANEISITKALSRGKDNRLYIKSTKTGISRTIKMDKKTMDILKEWKKHQKELLGNKLLNSKQLVFSNQNNDFLQPTKTRKWILKVQKKYGLKEISTHKLRHTHCSLLFEAGASLKEVQDRL
ncbi:site-specific integrase, partial [Calidifontibacillus erzurumensis]